MIFNTNNYVILINTMCSICHDCETELITPCRHTFCYTCINEWLDINKQCPYCRGPLMRGDLVDGYLKFIGNRLVTRQKIGSLKKDYILEVIQDYIYRINDCYNRKDKIEIYEELNRFLYINKYYLRKLDKNKRFIKVMLKKIAEISEESSNLYCWYVKFNDYFLIK